MIQLIVFLGNYGTEYEKTRHNVAWQFADSLPFAESLSWRRKFKGTYAVVDFKSFAEMHCAKHSLHDEPASPVRVPKNAPEKLFFLKPETYMNNSGQSIIELASFFKIKPEEILVVHDELELPLGTVSLKWAGGLGGHNGLRSTKAVLNTADFWRLRFGISKPQGKNIADYVLSSFTEDEEILLSQIFPQAAKLLTAVLCSADASSLIPAWGKKNLLEKE